MSANRTAHKRKDKAIAIKEHGRFVDMIPSPQSRIVPTVVPLIEVIAVEGDTVPQTYDSLQEKFELANPELRATVAICMQDSHGRWLQIRRAYDNRGGGKVGFAAGKVEQGESQEDAVRREAFEELGVQVVPLSCFGEVNLPEWNVRMYAWEVEFTSETFAPSAREVAEILWLSPQQIVDHPDALRSSALIVQELPTNPSNHA